MQGFTCLRRFFTALYPLGLILGLGACAGVSEPVFPADHPANPEVSTAPVQSTTVLRDPVPTQPVLLQPPGEPSRRPQPSMEMPGHSSGMGEMPGHPMPGMEQMPGSHEMKHPAPKHEKPSSEESQQ